MFNYRLTMLCFAKNYRNIRTMWGRWMFKLSFMSKCNASVLYFYISYVKIHAFPYYLGIWPVQMNYTILPFPSSHTPRPITDRKLGQKWNVPGGWKPRVLQTTELPKCARLGPQHSASPQKSSHKRYKYAQFSTPASYFVSLIFCH